jgi:hypothetical protein
MDWTIWLAPLATFLIAIVGFAAKYLVDVDSRCC